MNSRQRKCREAALKRWADPKFRRRMTKVFKSPSYRKKVSKGVRRSITEQVRKDRSANTKKLWKDPSYRERVSKGVRKSYADGKSVAKRNKSVKDAWTPEKRHRRSRLMKRLWKRDADARYDAVCRARAKVANRKNMTNGEKELWSILKALRLGFVFTGTRKKVAGNKTPDFVREQDKLAIELYGSWHVHTKKEDEERIDHIKRAGWKVLIIWDKHLENSAKVINRILRFASI